MWALVAASAVALLGVLEVVREALGGELDPFMFGSSGVGPDGLIEYTTSDGTPPDQVDRFWGLSQLLSQVGTAPLIAAALPLATLAALVRAGLHVGRSARLAAAVVAGVGTVVCVVGFVTSVRSMDTGAGIPALPWAMRGSTLSTLPDLGQFLAVAVVLAVSAWGLLRFATDPVEEPEEQEPDGDAPTLVEPPGVVAPRPAHADPRPEPRPEPEPESGPGWGYDPADYRRPR